MPRHPNETAPSQFRFTPDTLAAIDRLAAFHGLANRADLLRFLVIRADKDRASKERKKTSKKSA